MTQDEIIRMMKEAGFYIGETDEFHPEWERFAALVAAHEAEKWKAVNKRDYENWKMAAEKAAECEREACAKVCEDYDSRTWMEHRFNMADEIAAAIRARGKK